MAPIIGLDAQGRKTFTFKHSGAIENWIVPMDVTKVRIKAVGAEGGNVIRQGKGASVEGDFNLAPNEVLKIVIGEKGKYNSSAYPGGGGGGTFVIRDTQTPLIVAGGGGGAGRFASEENVNASLTTSGNSHIVERGGKGGTGGSGGSNGSTPAGNAQYGSGGGGLIGDGQTGYDSTGGKSFINSAVGGATKSAFGGNGGFGGGGASSGFCGGGGGGYSGGAGGGLRVINTTNYYYNGTGGGSYNAGENPSTVLATTTGNGSVVITVLNASPTLTLATTNDRTLYESDTYAINGTAADTDAGDVVMVKYKINNGTVRTVASPVSTGAEFPFNRSLTFKEGKLFDGATAVTTALAEGTQHVLTVWAEDDKGGKSAEQTRTFYVVPNRPPKLTVDPITPKTDMIDTDSFEIKGTVNNPDANGVKVHYKIGNSAYQEVFTSDGAGGEYSFRVSLSQLADGANTLTVRATDAFGAVDTKTITITKSGTSLPLKTAVTRYKLTPPNGTAKGVLLWIERETGDLTVDAKISMTNVGEAESYQPMNKTATAFVREGIEEDEFTYDAGIDKTEIYLQLDMQRTSTVSNKGITLISGVFA